MEKVKRCAGQKGHWECIEEYPDHMVPVEKFGIVKDGFQSRCHKCAKYRDGIRNPIRNAIISEAEKLVGGRKVLRSMPKEYRAKVMEMAKDNKAGPDNILQFTPQTWTSKSGELKTANSVTLKSTVRNDGLPKGIVTPSEKKVRRETKRIKYEPEGWIYALKNHMAIPGFLKLGKTNDLKRRLADFNTAGDFEMMYWVKVDDAKVAEDMLHAYFIDSHHLREWFKVDLKDAIKAMDSIANTVNNNKGDASENAISKS